MGMSTGLRPSNETTPAVLALHGGGWRGGHREMMEAGVHRFCAARLCRNRTRIPAFGRGEMASSAERPPNRSPGRSSKSKAASYKSRPHLSDRLFGGGPSFAAGRGHARLAAEAVDSYSEQSDAVTGIAAFFPPARIAGRFASLLGIAENALDLVSPQTYASTLPPTIIFCGDEDSVTPPQLSIDPPQSDSRGGRGPAICACSRTSFMSSCHYPGMMETTVRDAVEFFDRTAVNQKQVQSGA